MAQNTSAGGVDFALTLDTGALERALRRTAEHIDNNVSKAFRRAGNNAEQSMQKTTNAVNRADKSVSRFSTSMRRFGVILAGAFAVGKIVNFGKSCLQLGSDLQEVQNVVDVAFPTMSKQVDKFAKDAAQSFGLSETMAKRYAGTFGTMARSFGFTEKAAASMGTTLAGLSGDVASFYNISQDEAYTKLKSVFTGETESLKELGVVMTQNALDQYALANGYARTTAQMTEQEKVALRYAFVQQQLANATGYFARTSDSWAKQVRIFNLQVQSLKATIGEGLINLFAPIIKVINTAIQRLMSLANAFKAFTELITGKKSADNASASVASVGASADATAGSIGSAANAADELATNTTKAGKAAQKAAKQALGLMGFDAINKLSDNSSSNSDSSSGSGGTSGDAFNLGGLETGSTVLDSVSESFQKTADRFRELQELFKEGFKIGFGDTNVLDSIKTNLDSIKRNLHEIFSDRTVKDSANGFLDSLSLNLGKISGSFASIGATVADNLTGGFSRYLEDNKDRIKKKIISVLNVGSEIAELGGDLATATAEIFSAFRSDDAKGVTADIISFFSEGVFGATEVLSKFGRDALRLITQPIVQNKDKLKKVIEETLSPLKTVTGAISTAWTELWNGVQRTYDKHVKPLFDSVTHGISEILSVLADGYNTYIAPTLRALAKLFSETLNKHVTPLLDSLLQLLGALFDLLKTLWETILQPVAKLLTQVISPVLAKIAEVVGTVLLLALQKANDLLKGLVDKVTSLVKWLNTAIKTVTDFVAAIKKLPTQVSVKITAVKDKAFDAALTAWNKIKNSTAVKTIKASVTKTYNDALTLWNKIKNSTAVKTLKATVSNTLTSAKKTWDSLKSKTLQLSMTLKGKVSDIKNTVNAVIDSINKNVVAKIKLTIPKTFPFVGGKTIGPPPNIPKLAEGGYVRANAPQLAMIGDNKRYGEIVAPEPKLEAMARKAAELSGGNNERLVEILLLILEELQKDRDMYVDGDKLTRKVIQHINGITRSTGRCPVIT